MKAILDVSNPMPLCFRSSPSKESAETLRYIPGSAFLGSLAEAHQRLGKSEKEFMKFFSTGQIQFGNLYPVSVEKASKDFINPSLPIRPLPLTARSCKRFSGFAFNMKPEDEERHGVSDQLCHWALFALSQEQNSSIIEQQSVCHFTEGDFTCEQIVEPFTKGFYWRGFTPDAIGSCKSEQRMLTRTGISRQRGAVQEEILYNREVLLENQTFRGHVLFDDRDVFNQFNGFLDKASHHEMIYVGNNRTRGLGKLRGGGLRASEQTLQELQQKIERRVHAFTNRMVAMGQNANIALPHALYIPFTLQSDAILRESPTRYRTTLDSRYFEQIWGLQGFELAYQAARTRRILGWNAFLGLPKTVEIAVKMGSVFLLGYNGTTDHSFWQALVNMDLNGIGERRQEGFGEVTVADPFHLEDKPL